MNKSKERIKVFSVFLISIILIISAVLFISGNPSWFSWQKWSDDFNGTVINSTFWSTSLIQCSGTIGFQNIVTLVQNNSLQMSESLSAPNGFQFTNFVRLVDNYNYNDSLNYTINFTLSGGVSNCGSGYGLNGCGIYLMMYNTTAGYDTSYCATPLHDPEGPVGQGFVVNPNTVPIYLFKTSDISSNVNSSWTLRITPASTGGANFSLYNATNGSLVSSTGSLASNSSILYLAFEEKEAATNNLQSIGLNIYNFSILANDTVFPTAILNSPVNNANTSTATVTFNATAFDSIGVVNVSLIINGIINQTNSSRINNSNYLFPTFMNDGRYNWSYNVVDNVGNSFNTSNFTLLVDTTPPVITIFSPLNQFYGSDIIKLNFSVFDAGIGVNKTWFFVENSTAITVVPITFVTTNTTFTVPRDDSYIVVMFSNDSLNNIGTSGMTFSVSTVNPIVINSIPVNTQWFTSGQNINVSFNASTQASPLSLCQLNGNFSGSYIANQSFVTPVNNSQLSTLINVSNNNWYIWSGNCSNQAGYSAYSLYNYSFGVDNIPPVINTVTTNTNAGSQTFTFYANVSDNLALNQCWRTIYNSTGQVDPATIVNQTFTCNSLSSSTVSNYDTYNMTVYANDSAGNQATPLNVTFSTSPSSGNTTTTGGGGGGTVYSGSTNWTMTTDTGTQSENIYKVANTAKTFTVLLQNIGTTNRTIDFQCQDVTGSLCQYIVFQNTTISLPVQANVSVPNQFTLTFPSQISNIDETFNIVAASDLGATDTRFVTVYVQSSTGLIASTIAKLFVCKDIGLGCISYALIAVLILIIVSLLLGVFAFPTDKVKLGPLYAFLIGVFAAILFLVLF